MSGANYVFLFDFEDKAVFYEETIVEPKELEQWLQQVPNIYAAVLPILQSPTLHPCNSH